MDLKGLKINFLGDSITQGDAGTSSRNFAYHSVLKAECGLAEARNYGINGTRIANQQAAPTNEEEEWLFSNSFCQRFDQMDDDADVVVVFGGTNDHSAGDAPLGTFSDRTPDTFYGACHYLFRGLTLKYLGKPVVVMTPLHRDKELDLKGFHRKFDTGLLKDYVNIIREVAEYYGIPVLDLFATCAIQPEIPEHKQMYMPDGIHPNDAGHAMVARKLKNFLEAL
ncbi:MAG: SGNH/GDSL hydrolase family protein [Clostridia bacterium]|nr:SGNH/GDSL hydrolase family protein [Clostridia bacterium]